jgi:hypothetical protein
MNEIEKNIFDLEYKLQSVGGRSSVEELNNLIADDFLEFGTSGNKYNKQDTLKSLPTEDGKFKYSMSDFSVKQISDNIIQAIYKTDRTENDANKVTSLRSSLWRNENGQWRMFFHQGTKVN